MLDFRYESEAHKDGVRLIAGVDEAGRGPWAGPVVAAAVILDQSRIPAGINDSKKLSSGQREALYEKIVATSTWSVGVVDVHEIERINLHFATLLAMQQACMALNVPPDLVLIDGKFCPDLPCRSTAIIGGDAISPSIAAASIIAKVTRDRLMGEIALEYPDYGFEKHKGYGTPDHQKALIRFGITPHHRRNFAPVQLVLTKF